MPPPSVIPPMPTDAVSPNPVASPCALAATVYSPAVSPASAHAVLPAASISSRFCAERSSTIPPSIDHTVARHAVAAAAHGQRNTRLARHLDDARDVCRVHRPRDRGRPAVVTVVVERARGVVLRVAGRDHLARDGRSEEHTSELQSCENLVCRLLLEKKKNS